jgi:phosphate starvation-inducible PhoH-like protein
MTEKLISLEGIDPIYVFGVNNVSLDLMRKHFPKLKIMTRGNEVKVSGDLECVELFESRLLSMVDYFHKYNSLSEDEIEEILVPRGKHLLKTAEDAENVIVYGVNGKLIKARTVNQLKLVNDYDDNDLMFAIGPAGTGKTYTGIALAVRALRNKEIKRIILTRPAVEAGEKLGFLPGNVKDKLDPYLQPLYDALNDMIPAKKLDTLIDEGYVQIAPLAFMRGRTLDNAFVILDEAQNATVSQMKMFLTRMGRNAKFIVTGDVTQIDLPDKSKSGLLSALTILKNIKGISIVEFDSRDIIRHRLVKYIVAAYDKMGMKTEQYIPKNQENTDNEEKEN